MASKKDKLIAELDATYGDLVREGIRVIFVEDVIPILISKGFKEKKIKKVYKEQYGKDRGWY